MLIVGGGPVGLAASVLLSDLGVDSLVVERSSATSDHPKAHVVNTRTMEIFRSLGVADAVREASIGSTMLGYVRWVRSLAGEELAHLTRGGGTLPPSPERSTSCAQDRVEQVLLAATAHRRGLVRFGTEAISVDPDDDGVTVTFADGRRQRARYVIAADGATSGVRAQLGVTMDGLPELATMVGTYFHADLSRWTDERPALLYWVLNSAAPGTFIALDGVERWMFHRSLPPDAPDVEADKAAAGSLVRVAIGDPDVEVDVRSVRPWRMTAQIADRYRVGRVFLAGDAAHRFPPTGGLGLNTGVQDAHNLAWKLARVLSGASPEALLDTYEQERRPVAQQNCDFSVDNARAGSTIVGPGVADTIAALESGGTAASEARARLRADVEANRAHFGGIGMDLGFTYQAGALVTDSAPMPPPDPATYTPAGHPGARAPHLLIDAGSGPISTLDRFGRDFVLLVAGPTGPWGAQPTIEIPPGEPYGLEPGGAALVRPDGHIAWRCITPPADPAQAIVDARVAISCP